MDKNEVLLVAQLIKTMQGVVNQMGEAEANRNREQFERLKKEALELHKKIDALL